MIKQVCPKCGSKNVRLAETISKLGNPILTQGMVGWECLDCGYIGKDFFISVLKDIDWAERERKIEKLRSSFAKRLR